MISKYEKGSTAKQTFYENRNRRRRTRNKRKKTGKTRLLRLNGLLFVAFAFDYRAFSVAFCLPPKFDLSVGGCYPPLFHSVS